MRSTGESPFRKIARNWNVDSDRLMHNGEPQIPLHISIQNNSGSVEHYYHFLLGFLIPLAALFSREPPDARIVLIRSCGPMDRHLRELGISGLTTIDKVAHRGMRSQTDGAEFVSLQGFDFGPQNLTYNQDGIRSGVAFVRDWLRKKTDQFSAEIVRSWSNRSPKILLIERGEPDPFYFTEASEGKAAGNRRRTIANHSKLLVALSQRYCACCNLVLERLSLAEQIAWYSSADVVVAQQGAALSNVVWMRPGTAVIEIAPTATQHYPTYRALAALTGVRFAQIPQADNFAPVDPSLVIEAIEKVSNLNSG